MTDQQKIDALNSIRTSWTGETSEGYYMSLTIHILTTLYNEQHQNDLMNGDEVISLIGQSDDYVL